MLDVSAVSVNELLGIAIRAEIAAKLERRREDKSSEEYEGRHARGKQCSERKN